MRGSSSVRCRVFPGDTESHPGSPVLQDVIQRCDVLLQGQRRRLGSRAALHHLGVMEEAEGEGPVAVREGPGGHGPPPASQSTTTNLLASVKEQVGDTFRV